MTVFFTRRARNRLGAWASCACCVLAAASTIAIAGEARSARRAAIVEDIAPPTRGGFDEIVVQMPPLVPIQKKSRAQSAPQPSPSESVAAAVDAPPPLLLADPKAAPEPNVAEAPKAESPAEAASAPAQANASAKPDTTSEREQTAEEPAAAGEQTPAPAEAQGGAASPSLRGAEHPVASASSDALPEATPEPPAAEARSEPAPVAQAAKPEAEQGASESGGEGALFETWQLLIAAFAAAGLLFVRLRREKKEKPAPPKQARPRSARIAQFIGVLRTARTKAAPFLEATLRLARVSREKLSTALRRRAAARQKAAPAAEASAKPRRSPAVNWSEIAVTLCAKIAPAKRASAAPARAEPERAARPAEATSAASAADDSFSEREKWSQGDHDIELLEPGAATTQAIIMSARRKLRAAQG